MPDPASPLPYTDTKPVGAADFYAAINATFRFIHARLGEDGLRRYWQEMGTQYHAPVAEKWREGGLQAVADHWRAFFDAEPGAEVEVTRSDDEVFVNVKTCPAIDYLRRHERDIFPAFCQHCHFVSDAIAAPAGLAARVKGGNGSCEQRFVKRTPELEPQNLEDIAKAS